MQASGEEMLAATAEPREAPASAEHISESPDTQEALEASEEAGQEDDGGWRLSPDGDAAILHGPLQLTLLCCKNDSH